MLIMWMNLPPLLFLRRECIPCSMLSNKHHCFMYEQLWFQRIMLRLMDFFHGFLKYKYDTLHMARFEYATISKCAVPQLCAIRSNYKKSVWQRLPVKRSKPSMRTFTNRHQTRPTAKLLNGKPLIERSMTREEDDEPRNWVNN